MHRAPNPANPDGNTIVKVAPSDVRLPTQMQEGRVSAEDGIPQGPGSLCAKVGTHIISPPQAAQVGGQWKEAQAG